MSKLSNPVSDLRFDHLWFFKITSLKVTNVFLLNLKLQNVKQLKKFTHSHDTCRRRLSGLCVKWTVVTSSFVRCQRESCDVKWERSLKHECVSIKMSVLYSSCLITDPSLSLCRITWSASAASLGWLWARRIKVLYLETSRTSTTLTGTTHAHSWETHWGQTWTLSLCDLPPERLLTFERRKTETGQKHDKGTKP